MGKMSLSMINNSFCRAFPRFFKTVATYKCPLWYWIRRAISKRKRRRQLKFKSTMPSLPPPPNPRALYSAIQTLTVQPRGFGGSSGFGRARGTDPRRTPLFQRTVVLCNSIEACQAARFVGARCISKVDNDLADAVVNKWDEFTIDDIATPGSFLLNPPQPKDDYGNCVDIYELMDHYYEQQGVQGQPQSTTVKQQTQPPLMDNEDDMARILADLDSL